MDLVLKKTFYQSRVVWGKLQSRNRDACSQTVVIVDTIQIEVLFQRKLDGLLSSAVVSR